MKVKYQFEHENFPVSRTTEIFRPNYLISQQLWISRARSEPVPAARFFSVILYQGTAETFLRYDSLSFDGAATEAVRRTIFFSISKRRNSPSNNIH